MATSGGQETDSLSAEQVAVTSPTPKSSKIVTSSTNGRGKPPVDVEYTHILSVKYLSTAEDFPCRVLNKTTVPLVESAKCVDFESIADKDINFQFVMVYCLKQGKEEGMQSILDKISNDIDNDKVLGLIIVNTLDTTTPHHGFWDVESCDFAVYTVNQKDGLHFMDILNNGEPVLVQVLEFSSVETPSVPAELQSVDKTSGQSSQSSKSNFNTQLQKYLETISESKKGLTSALLAHVITHFRTFECQEMGTALDKGLKVLKKRVSQDGFPKEILLHLVIVYRILDQRVKKVYGETLCTKYAIKFLNKMDKLFAESPQFVIRIVTSFITQSQDNHLIPWIGDSKHIRIFEVVGNACEAMAKRLKECGKPSSFGMRMFWYNLALKFHCEYTEAKRYWWKVCEKESKSELKGDNVMESCKNVKKAVSFGQDLGIPNESAFTSEDLAEVVIRVYRDCYFDRLRMWVSSFDASLLSGVGNLIKFMTVGFDWLSKDLTGTENDLQRMSSSGDTVSSFKQGIDFLCDVIGRFKVPEGQSRKDHLECMCSTLDLWWKKVMLDCVLLKHPKETVEGVRMMLTKLKDSDPTSSKLLPREHLRDTFDKLLHSKVVEMNMEQYVIYARDYDLPLSVFKEFLSHYKKEKVGLQKNLVSQPFFQDLIAVYFKNWPTGPALFHKLFSDLILRAGESHDPYHEFLSQLLRLKSDKLLSVMWVKENETDELMRVQVEFKSNLEVLIQKEKLTDIVSVNFRDFIKVVPMKLNPIREVVLSVLTKFVYVRDSKDLRYLDVHNMAKPIISIECLKLIIPLLVQKYKEEATWTTPPVPPYTYYWDILKHACQLMKPTSHSDPEWCTIGSVAIPHLAQVLAAYSKSHNTKSLNMENKALSECEDENMKQYFQWVQSVQEFIRQWQHKIVNDEWTQVELLNFANFEVSVSKMTKALFIETTEDIHYTALKEWMSGLCDSVESLLVRGCKEAESRCSVLGILAKYNVTPKPPLQALLSRSIAQYQERLLRNPMLGAEEVNEEGFFVKSLTVKELDQLNDELHGFLLPLKDHMDFLVHFVMNNSHLFAEYLQDQMKEIEAEEATLFRAPSNHSFTPCSPSALPDSVQSGISVEVFCGAVERTYEFLKGILTGQATYGTLCSLGCFQDASVVGAVDVDKELHIIRDFPFKGVEAHTVARGIKSILKLIQFSGYLESIIGVCEQYNLTGCLEDEGFHQLKMIHEAISSEETKTQLTGVQSEDYLTQVRKILDLKDQDEHCLALFEMLRDSTDFYQFLKEKNYKGPEGATYFRQQHTLITQQLQHEEYNEQVLNHLLVAFRYISPFLNCEQNLTQLMSQIYQNTRDQATKFHNNAFCQLQTVNRNIHLVWLWFTRAESDSLESIADDLSSLLKTGEFEFTICEATFVDGPDMCGSPVWWTGGQQRELRLHYTPSSTAATPDTTQRVTWDLEKIEDFTRRLGFLEKGQENQDHKDFQQLSLIVQRMFTVQCKLKDLGCPHKMITKLLCSELQEAQDLLRQLECKLKEWRGDVKSLQKRYSNLLFFSIPKVLKMSALLTAGNFDGVLQEVLFLFNASASKYETIRQEIVDATAGCGEEKETPIAFVGSVLQALYTSEKVAVLSYPTRSLCSVPDGRSVTLKPTCVMHLAEGFHSKDIIQLIFEIYNHGIPGPYEVYRCRPDSTEEELALFFRRIVKFMYLEYTILNVELLSPKLQEVLLKLHLSLERSSHAVFKVHYIATRSTVLQGMPYLTLKEHKPNTFKYDWKKTSSSCREILNDGDRAQTYLDFELVYGGAGNGKTHYIKEKIGRFKHQKLTIAVNESFNVHTAIRQMRSLKMEAKSVVYFSFTLIAPSPESTRDDVELYNSVMTKVWWFLFDLFFLGYVEDPETGISFTMPQGLQWSFYFEVPVREGQNPDSSLELFCNEFPALELIGRPCCVREDNPYKVDSDVQLVCKYLRAYEMVDDREQGINKLHPRGLPGGLERLLKPIKFSVLPDLCDKECHRLLNECMPDSVKRSKMQQKLFIRYMKRRCQFFEEFPAFNHNQGGGDYRKKDGSIEHVDTTKMGSTLMGTMLLEVTNFCDPQRRDNWARTNTSRQQLVYSDGAFNLIMYNPEELSVIDQQKYKVMGVEIPDSNELSMRGYLDRVLGMALNLKNSSFEVKPLLVALGETKIVEVIKPIEKQQYVLTLDYTLKMLEIHERFECGVPVIIEGETGVGKTALVEMLSILWNDSLLGSYDVLVDNIYTLLNRVSEGEAEAMPDMLGVMIDLMGAIQTSQPVSLEDLEKVCSLKEHDITTTYRSKDLGRPLYVYEVLANYICDTVTKPVVTLLDIENVEKERASTSLYEDYPELTYGQLVEEIHREPTCKNVAHLLFYVLRAKPLKTFHKLNIHAALTPKDYMDFFRPAINQATYLKEKWMSSVQLPKVTVFLDEINTSSCLGLLKEVIVDGTFFGEPLPENLFIIAACNPHRGNSIIVNEQKQSGEMWLRSTYNVHRLPPTIQTLMWDYGALDSDQEKQYVKVKMRMMSSMFKDTEWFADELSNAIIHSQGLIRGYAATHLKETFGYPQHQAEELAHSCVSQRDIQRVFTLFEWLTKGYKKFREIRFAEEDLGRNPDKVLQEHAIMGALGIVYYLRLNDKFRQAYQEDLQDRLRLTFTTDIERSLQEELDFYAKHLSIPRGIAKTRALMENLFSIIACCCTRTPLIIVGAPGSSKTLSFNLALSNLKGAESKIELFRNSDIFPSLDPHFYQCSRRTTSTEVETVFQRAIKRQAGFNELGMRINCVVFMDEAGLPEESHESLKVLHKYLDSKEVAFVAISNHPLDAAKTNRAVSLYRATYTKQDIKTLAKECLGAKERSNAAIVVERLCEQYDERMNSRTEFSKFFGLRDFIHLIHYLRRTELPEITPQLVMKALERNFNGYHKFEDICRRFLKQMQSAPEKVQRRSIVDILRNSLGDQPQRSLQKDQETYDEVRYKLIIDPSEDGSVSRLLTMYKVLDPEQTRIFICSEFPEDSHLQKVNTIAAIRHAAEEGKTVLMSQTDDIHESFYDLFNQHFRRIDNPDPTKEPKFYANIAIGSHHKPCRVHKDFQCVVIIKESEVKDTPAPFLNRFEKYRVSHKDFLRARLDSFPPCMRIAVTAALEKVEGFFDFVGEDSFYGAKSGETVDSLAVSILPTPDPTFKYVKLQKAPEEGSPEVAAKVASAMKDSQEASYAEVSPSFFVLFRTLLDILRSHCRFHIGKLSDEELEEDAVYILKMLCEYPSDFKGIAQAIDENKYSEEDLIKFVREAVDHLYSEQSPDMCKTEYVSSESCFVVMVFVQWLVQYMCKHLLQLMTAEALTLHRKQIPLWCLNTYLRHQSHFCLKNLIERNLGILQNGPQAGTVSTKLVCFTRFTPDINQLPSVLPPDALPLSSSTIDGRMIETMQKMICEEPDNVYLCKLSNITSEQAFRKYLKSFKDSIAKVMVLVINMQETKKQMVNHIRIMVEQAEGSPRNPKKLFVLLLHFPPSMFYDCCYPALFLNGWDHHYFDSLQPELEGVVDIRLWFTVACQRDKLNESHTIVRDAAQNMMRDTGTVNIIASRVAIGSKNGGEFNSTPRNGNERLTRFQKLLESPVGDVLCDMYAKYWKPSEMARYLEEAASYARNRKSTLSMTDSVGDFFQTAFHNFLAYMINMMNKGLNLDNVYKVVAGGEGSSDKDRIKADCFLRIMKCLSPPKLMELKAYNNNWNAQAVTGARPSFPFFHKICLALDVLLEDSERDLQLRKKELTQSDKEEESPEVSNDENVLYFTHLQGTFNDLLKGSVESGSNPMLSAVVEAITEHPVLWQLYCQDFIAAKFHLDMNRDRDTLTAEVCNLKFAQASHQPDVPGKLTYLHCLAHTSHINLARVISSLRPIQQLQSTFQQQEPSLCLSPHDKLKQLVRDNPNRLNQGLVQFIIDTMFHAFAFGCLKFHKSLVYTDLGEFGTWRRAYHTMPSVKELQYQTKDLDESYQGKLNIMTTVFLLLQTRSQLTETINKLAFSFGNKLLTKFFDEHLQDSRHFPHLMEIINCFEEVVSDGSHQDFTQDDRAVFLENLLMFFFTVKTAACEDDIIWFLRYVNSPPHPSSGSPLAPSRPSPLPHLPSAVLQHILGAVLTFVPNNEKPAPPLNLFQSKVRELVARKLLEVKDLGEMESYKPVMYRQLPSVRARTNPRMSQPLADLYFVVVMEQLMGEGYSKMNLNSALIKMKDMKNCLDREENSSERILLQIELQAVLQFFLHKTAESLADEGDRKDAMSMAEGICGLVTGEVQGSEANIGAGNKLVLLMHLLKAVKGPVQLINLLNTGVSDKLSFLKPYKEQLEHGSPVNVHYWPFMLPGAKGQLAEVYTAVSDLMSDVVKAEDTDSPKATVTLIHGLQTICSEETKLRDGGDEIDRRAFVRMTIWLTVYCQNMRSAALKEAICDELDFVGFTKEHKLVLECFLSPDVMRGKCRREIPLPSDVNAEVLEVDNGQVRPKRGAGNKAEQVDPIYKLFEQDKLKGLPLKLDPSDTSLRNALANLLAVVFSLPSESTHLWYLFHDPTKLRDTFLPGFMYPHKVNKDKMLYDCGILLNEDGEFRRPDYRDHDSGLSLHSFYLVTWSTIGTLCMSLLTNPQAQEAVHGHLISDWQPLRHFCLQQLRHIWLSMQTNLELNNEERDFFIVEAMFSLFKKVHSGGKLPGVFKSSNGVQDYERMWHKEIYDSSMNGLKEKLRTHVDLLKELLFITLNQLDSQYPQIPSEKQLKNNLESIQDCSEEPKHTVLLKFLEDRHRLAVGSALLPDLVEFYLWLDVHLAHLIRYEVAQTLSVDQLMRRACERYPSEAARLKELFARMKENFNKYIKLHGEVLGAGGCHRQRHDEVITAISDKTPVINFLSTKRGSIQKDQDEENEANDWIFLTIRDIATVHNNLIDHADASLDICWMLSKVEKVDVREFSSQLDGVFSGNNKWLLSLIQSRYIPVESLTRPEVPLTSIQHTRSQPMFDLSKLESDIVRYFIAGKRTIDVSTLWKPFRFRDDGTGASSATGGLTGPGVPVDLAALSQELPPCCKDKISAEERKKLETDFHDATYNTLSELVKSLKAVSGYMHTRYKVEVEEMLEDSLLVFLRRYFDAKDASIQELFNKLGLDEKCLKPEQLETLEKVKMRNLFRTLEMFVGWIGDCLFDFHMLPFSVKTPLPSEVVEAIQRASITQDDVEELEGTVSHLAQMFGSEEFKFQPTQTLRECLTELHFYEEKGLPSYLLPLEVQIQHYVYYTVLLRRLKLELKRDAATVEVQNDHHTPRAQWSEMVPDMWKRLPHFQDNFKDHSLPVVYPTQLDNDNVISEGTESKIWLDKAPSIDPFQEPQETSISNVVEEDEHTDSVRVSESPPLVRQSMPSEPSASIQLISSQTVVSEPIPSQPTTNEPSSSQSVPSVPTASQLGQSPDVEGPSSMLSMTASTKPPSEKALNMTVEEVVQWLDTIKLGQHAEAFMDMGVDGALLSELESKNLEELGISSELVRKKILVKFRQI